MQLVSTTVRHFRLLPTVASLIDPCLMPILADLHRLLMLHSYRRTRVLRFDLILHRPQPQQVDNTCLGLFMHHYRQFLDQRVSGMQYLWVRSDQPGIGTAYRLVFLLDAAESCGTPELLEAACRCWHEATGMSGSFDPCCTKTYRFPIGNGIVINTDEADWGDAFAYAFRWASCISLAHGVGLQPFGIRPFGCSIPASEPVSLLRPA
jgi:hypothetical protein